MSVAAALTYESYVGAEIAMVLAPLGELRIAVFKAFPYLYEGDLAYEQEYLKTYTRSADSFLHTVWDGDALVGATTCIPLVDETEEVRQPFRKAGMEMHTICYFGESILLPQYRGHGIGHLFFDVREAHARQLGLEQTCFCAVERPANHPMRPAQYRPLDDFWLQRGYVKVPQLQSQFEWKDLGATQPTFKTMTYWMREGWPP